MKKYIILPLVIFTLLISSCSEDYQLQKSVFVEDVNNPELPIYSEWGYNTFGVYIDRQPFISNSSDLPAKIIVNKDTFNLVLKGTMNNRDVTMKFSIIGYSPADYTDLISLNDSTFNLTSNKCIVTMTTDTIKKLNIFEGKLFFKRAQSLYVDKEYMESILSGTFSFKTFINGEPIAVSNGRFDFGIGYENFYNY